MARRKKYSALSIMRYRAKTKKLYLAHTGDVAEAGATADVVVMNWIAGQGAYAGVRRKVSKILDELQVPNAIRVPFMALAQKLAKMVLDGSIKGMDDLDDAFNRLAKKYFPENTPATTDILPNFKNKLIEELFRYIASPAPE